jgi:SH3-like domain-containing protein
MVRELYFWVDVKRLSIKRLHTVMEAIPQKMDNNKSSLKVLRFYSIKVIEINQ